MFKDRPTTIERTKMKNKKILGLNINIILLGLISFLNDISSEMILPILPILIKSFGGSGIIIGLAGGLRDGFTNILKIFSGYYSDKIQKRKVFIVSGYFISSIFKSLLYLAKTWPQVLFITGTERFGKGLRDAPRDALIAMYTTQRGKAIGFHRAMDTTGAIVGSVLTFLLIGIFFLDIKTIIFIAAIFSILTLIPSFFIKEKKYKDTVVINSSKKISPSLKYFLFISGFFTLSNFSYMFFILKAQQQFTNKNAITITLFLYVLYNIFHASFAIPIGILSDKIGRKKIIILTYLFFSTICLGFLYSKNIYHLIVLFIFYGIFNASINCVQKALVIDLSHEKIRATALGLFETVNGILFLITNLIVGFLWEKISNNSIFLYGFTISFISVILFLMFTKKIKTY